MLGIILNKLLLGISLAAPIGPVNTEMIKRGLANGFWAAFSIRLGGAITNSIFLTVVYFGLEKLIKHQKLISIVYFIGEVTLICMGTKTIIKACSKKSVNTIKFKDINHKNSYTIKNGLLTGIILSATSPIGITFWLTSFPASIATDHSSLLINCFIILGVIVWGVFISGLLHLGCKIINHNTLRIISGLSGLLLIYFGIKTYVNHH